MLEWLGLNSYHYDGLQPKMSAGMIEKHECTLQYFQECTKITIASFGGVKSKEFIETVFDY